MLSNKRRKGVNIAMAMVCVCLFVRTCSFHYLLVGVFTYFIPSDSNFAFVVILRAGYLACARCAASGVCVSIDPISLSSASGRTLKVPTTQRCPNCSGSGKVNWICINLTFPLCFIESSESRA